MALKLPVALYSTGLKQLQPGDKTPAESEAELARSLATRAESIGKKAESQGILDNSIADHAESEAKRGLSTARLANSYAHALNGATAYSFALVADSQADLAVGRASEATSMATRAASLARNAVEVSDISEASSLARRGNSLGRRAESQGILDNSIADHAESEAKRGLSLARRDESLAKVLNANSANFVVGPANAISGNLPTYNGTTGKLVQDSGLALSNVCTLSTLQAFAESVKSGFNLTGGGDITFDSDGNLSWTQRFVVISNGNGSNFAYSGYFDIFAPSVGTIITGVGGAANTTVTANGIPLANWQALYYILPIGAVNTSLPSNFRVVNYTGTLNIPENWLLIAIRNGDDSRIRLGTGIILKAGDTWTSTSSSVSGSGAASASRYLNQTAHGFTVGTPVYFTGSAYAKARADSVNTLATFVVDSVINANTFTVAQSGYISGLSGLTAGSYYFVSDTTAGAVTTVEPSLYSNPVYIAVSATEAYILPFRASASSNSASRSALPKWCDLVSTTDFATTAPASASITMVTDQRANIKVGMAIRFTQSGVNYYGVCTAITATLLTIHGAPIALTAGTLTGLAYSDLPDMVEDVQIFIPGYWADSADNALVLSDLLQPLLWRKSNAFLVKIDAYTRTTDTGATFPRINARIGSTATDYVCTLNSNAGIQMSAGGVWYNSGISIATSKYAVTYGSTIELKTDAYGGNDNASDLTVILTFVFE